MTTVTVELTIREAQALANIANLFEEIYAEETATITRLGVSPLVSGAAKLEIALMTEGCEA
jgi:hypothetical protein